MEETKGSLGQPGSGEDPGKLPARGARLLKFLIWVLVLASLAAGGTYGAIRYLDWRFLNLPPEAVGRNATLVILPGAGLAKVALDLREAGIVTDSRRFVKLAQAKGKGAAVRAGEFDLSTALLPERVLEIITTTYGTRVQFFVREGLPWWEVARLAAEARLCSASDFATAMADPVLLSRHFIPSDSAEGFLFPDTYAFVRSQVHNATSVVEAMLANFNRKAREVWPEFKPGGPPDPAELRRVVILGSIVEKETGNATERGPVAGVFANRLRINMLLQTDPATIYGLGPAFDGNLRRAHLDDKSNPYNTYQRPGLPPGPICSPGLASLKAAAQPEVHPYLYFVAKGDGTHFFSRNLDDHNAAVTRFQRQRNRDTYRSY